LEILADLVRFLGRPASLYFQNGIQIPLPLLLVPQIGGNGLFHNLGIASFASTDRQSMERSDQLIGEDDRGSHNKSLLEYIVIFECINVKRKEVLGATKKRFFGR